VKEIMGMIRVLIFDDNADRRDSLSMLVLTTPSFELAGAYPDCNNVIDDVKRTLPDVVLMDIGMPGINGVIATGLIKSNFPHVRILIQTVFEDENNIFEAIRAGASGYLLKKSQSSKIVEAINEVYAGGAPMNARVAEKVLNFFRTINIPTDKADYGLSKRELEVLECLVKGKSYKMIGEEMSITYNTVNSHIKKIYEKLHVHSVGEAVSKAIQEKIV
jgi:DNA-binding NarL/FixJ family response regulator